MIYKILISLISFIFVFGCASKQDYNITKIDISTYKSIIIDANDLLIDDQSENSIEYPFIDHLVLYNMKFYLNEWTKNRIVPNYKSHNQIKLTIKKANIKAFYLDSNNKIEDIFVNKAAKRVEIDVYVIIEIIDSNDKKLAYLDLKAFKSKELAENISLNENDHVIQNMINETLMDFDKLAVAKIKEIFSDYLSI